MTASLAAKAKSPPLPTGPDFLSRLLALSNFMRLSLRESRKRGRG